MSVMWPSFRRKRKQQDSIVQWRELLQREVPLLRTTHPLPSLDELSAVEYLQAQTIAKDISEDASRKIIGSKRRPTLFISNLMGLAAIHLLYPCDIPCDLFVVTEDEAQVLRKQGPKEGDCELRSPCPSFTAIFQPLNYAWPRLFDGTMDIKRRELEKRSQANGFELFLYTQNRRDGYRMEYGRIDVYAWNSIQLQLLERGLVGWLS